jgi:serine/threonine-protein kinase
MSAEELPPPDEQYTALFAAGEEALVSGRAAEVLDYAAVPPELQPRLEQDLACAQMLYQMLRQPTAAEDLLPGAAPLPLQPAPAGPESSPGLPPTVHVRPAPTPQRLEPALAAGAGPGPARDIQSLLHKRLRLAGLLLVSAYAYFVIADVLGIVRSLEYSRGRWSNLLLNGLVITVVALLATFLWRKRQIALRQLRVMELVALGVCLAQFAGSLVGDLFVARELAQRYALARTPEEFEDILFLEASTRSLGPFIIVVGYATLIPSGWRRCTLVVSITALIPLTISAAAGLVTLPALSTFLIYYLFPMGIYLAIAVAIAALGTHRIEMLRQEAAEARKLGQYQLKRRLGAGGMGEVYLAEHVLLKQPCAIKLIRPERAGDTATLRRFEREVQATARLKHWNTVQIFDYGHAADGTFYYVMEYLSGLTLEQLVKKDGPLPPGRAVHFLLQTCMALREAHGLCLIHRDIKPANIMICERGGVHDVVKLLDFGLVKAVGLDSHEEKLTLEGAVAGTPAYLSPEQAAGKDHLDARTDIYSLGAVAYFLLTGQAPFQREKAMQLIVAHIHEPVRPLTDLRAEVPADLQGVVMRCLEKGPAKRFADVNRLQESLAACGCAGQWTEEMAARWWQTHASQVNTPGDDPLVPVANISS